MHIDHFAVVDFVGFERMVEALGGVKMCVAHQLYDPVVNDGGGAFHGSGLNLPAGKSVEINGDTGARPDAGALQPRRRRRPAPDQAAAAVRRRDDPQGDQHGLLIDPLKLQHFLVAAASSLTTDGFGLGTMRKLASALHNVGAGGVHLLTVPNLTDQPGLPYGDVEWDPNKAPALWKAIRHDQPIPGQPGQAVTHASATPTPTPTGPPLTVSPSSIYVDVLNGAGTPGLAHTVADRADGAGLPRSSASAMRTGTPTRGPLVKYGSTKVAVVADRRRRVRGLQTRCRSDGRHDDHRGGRQRLHQGGAGDDRRRCDRDADADTEDLVVLRREARLPQLSDASPANRSTGRQEERKPAPQDMCIVTSTTGSDQPRRGAARPRPTVTAPGEHQREIADRKGQRPQSDRNVERQDPRPHPAAPSEARDSEG